MKRSILLTLVSAIVFTMIANAQPNRNGKLDDGFTWFETVSMQHNRVSIRDGL